MSLEMILIIVFGILAVVGLFVSIKIGKAKQYIQLLVTGAEFAFSKLENTEKFNATLDKFESKFPILSKILGRYWTKKAIHKAIDDLQKLIGTTSQRSSIIENQLSKIAAENIQLEENSKVSQLSNALIQKDFFGNSNLCSNEQVKEEAEKIISVGITPNLEKLKKSVIDFKFGYKF